MLLCYQYAKIQKCFDILSTIIRLVGSSILGMDDYQKFKYIFTNNIPIHIRDTKSEEYYSYLYLQNMSFAINITSSKKFFATLSLFVIKEGLRHYDNYTCELDSVYIDNIRK